VGERVTGAVASTTRTSARCADSRGSDDEGAAVLGTCVLDERIYPIDSVFFASGALNIEIEIPEDVTLDRGDHGYVVFAPDGTLIWRGVLRDQGAKVGGPARSIWRVTLALHITDGITDRVRARERS
jgi:hypothetical protein